MEQLRKYIPLLEAGLAGALCDLASMIGSSLVIVLQKINKIAEFRSSHPEVFLVKGVPKICSKFTGEHPYRSVI